MVAPIDVSTLVAAARGLTIQPRQRRWTHLSLCILDAVHSMDAHYDRIVMPICWRYVALADLVDPLLDVDRVHTVIGTGQEQPLAAFANWATELGEERLAGVLDNGQRTWRRRNAPYKARADIEYAETLVAHGINNLTVAGEVLIDDDRRHVVEGDLARVPGHGSGARRDYLWMLIGDDWHIKPDRMVLRWIARHLGRRVDVVDARNLICAAAEGLGATPWALDHAVWQHTSGRTGETNQDSESSVSSN